MHSIVGGSSSSYYGMHPPPGSSAYYGMHPPPQMKLTLAPIEIIATEATAIVADDNPVRIQHGLYCAGVSIISIRSFYFEA